MIFVNSNQAVGSKAFTLSLADELRPKLADILTADELDDFELDLTQSMIHFGFLSADKFNKIADMIVGSKDFNDERKQLLQLIKTDPRFS